MKRLSDQQRLTQLWALIDGELPAEERQAMLEQIAADPGFAQLMAGQLHLRRSLRQAVQREMPSADEALRRKVQALLAAAPAGSAEAAPPSRRAAAAARPAHRMPRPWRWAPLAAASLVLAVGGWFAYNATTPPAGHDAIAAVFEDQFVESLARRHTRCSRRVDDLLTSPQRFPTQISQMPQAIAAQLGGRQCDRPLDLSSIGFEFWKAGPCHTPGDKAVHLLYRHVGSDRSDAMSLWILRDEGEYDIEPDKLYHLTGRVSAHPAMAWRHDGLIYFLVGDDEDKVEDASIVLAGTP